MLRSAYGNITNTDFVESQSGTYNNESMSCALNMIYSLINRTSITGNGLIRDAYDADYYAISVPANSKTTAILFVPTGKNYCLYLLNSSGTVLTSQTTTGNKKISYFNSTSSSVTYYILVCGSGRKENGSSTQYSASQFYSLNICNAKNSRIWFGQQEYKVGTYEFWNADILQKLYINNRKYFTLTWEPYATQDLMEEGCNLTAIAMVLRNLGKTTTVNKYDFRTLFTGKLPADPYTVMLANISSYGTVTSTSSSRYDLTTSANIMTVNSYSNIATSFGATYNGSFSFAELGLTSDGDKADEIMEKLNSGYSNQGVIVRTLGHSIVVFKSNTPNAVNYADRFYVYDPADSLYSDGLHK